VKYWYIENKSVDIYLILADDISCGAY